MSWFASLERKFGKYAIPNLMRYVTLINILGALMGISAPGVYYSYLSLDVYKILHGQVWRLVTFIVAPQLSFGSGFLINLLFFLIMLYVYYWIGTSLEQAWGTFRFNAFYFGGVFLTILAAFIYYFVLLGANSASVAPYFSQGIAMMISLDEVNTSMFIMFAFLFPDMQFLFYFLIPIKAKWLGTLYLIMSGWQVFQCLSSRNYQNYMQMFMILASLLNFVIFYIITRKMSGGGTYRGRSNRDKRRAEYEKKKKNFHVYKGSKGEDDSLIKGKYSTQAARHKCAICGQTEISNPELEFRYCSKCEGSYEYCSLHLYTHEHIKKFNAEV